MIRDQDEINDKGDQKEQQRDYNDDHDDSMTGFTMVHVAKNGDNNHDNT